MRATATLQPAIWARRSTATSSGMRERRMNSSSRSTPQLAVLDHPHRGDHPRLPEDVGRDRVEAARRGAAEVLVVQAVADPGEDPVLPEHRREHGEVGLVGGPDPGVVGHEHAPRLDARARVAVLEDPLHRRAGRRDQVLQPGAEEDVVAGLVEDHRVEVVRVDHDRRARRADDRVAVLHVQVPERVAQDLEGRRVDVAALGVQQRRDRLRRPGRRHVGVGAAVERRPRSAGHGPPLGAPASR